MFLLSPVPLSLPSVDITCSSCLRLYFWGNLNLRYGSFIYAHVSRVGFHTVIVSFRQELAQDSPLAVKDYRCCLTIFSPKARDAALLAIITRQHQHHSHCDLLNMFLVSHTSQT